MRDFAKSKQPLTRIPVPNRLVYTVFLIFAAAGILSAVLLSHAGPGWTPESVAKYYRGEEAVAEDAESEPMDDSSGPVIDLPEFDPSGSSADPEPMQIHHAQSYRQILENSHQHLFSMPVFFLILAHLFARARFPRRFIHVGVGLTAFGLAGHIAGPWLVRYVGAGWSWFMLFTLGALIAGMLVMLLGSLAAMWWPIRVAKPTPEGTQS